jgi:hypothetical protein
VKQRVAVYRGLGGYGTLGLEIVLSILFGMFGGSWLDGRFGTEPWLMWLGFALGGAAAVRAILRALRLMRKETLREEREQGNPAPMYENERDRALRRAELAKQAEVKTIEDPPPSAPVRPDPKESVP